MASPTSTIVKKKALACYGHHKREVIFDANVSAAQELTNLRAAFLLSFGDMAELKNAEATDLIVQAKSELWSGHFVDVQDVCIPNHSVVNVILATPAKSVSLLSPNNIKCYPGECLGICCMPHPHVVPVCVHSVDGC